MVLVAHGREYVWERRMRTQPIAWFRIVPHRYFRERDAHLLKGQQQFLFIVDRIMEEAGQLAAAGKPEEESARIILGRAMETSQL